VAVEVAEEVAGQEAEEAVVELEVAAEPEAVEAEVAAEEREEAEARGSRGSLEDTESQHGHLDAIVQLHLGNDCVPRGCSLAPVFGNVPRGLGA
jgi:hypothetical protein